MISSSTVEDEQDNWTPVVSKSRKDSAQSANSSITNSNNTQKKSKWAQKNKRRRERKRLLNQQQRIMTQVGSNHDDDRECGSDTEENTLSRVLAASEIDVAAVGALNDNVDPRVKRLRNLRKKLIAAESLRESLMTTHGGEETKQLKNLEEDQIRKIERIPMLKGEILLLDNEIRNEREEQMEKERCRRKAKEIEHKERLIQWEEFAQGLVVDGFDATSETMDEFTCSLCAGPYEAPMLTVPCQHVFCRACLEESLSVMAERSKGNPESIVCPMCRSALFGIDTQKVTVIAAEKTRRRMKKRKCACRCGTEIPLSSLRRHLRECQDGAPMLFGEDTKKRFGHEFQQPTLDTLKVESYIRLHSTSSVKKKKNRGTTNDSNNHETDESLTFSRIEESNNNPGTNLSVFPTGNNNLHDFVPAGYDEEAEIQAAILLSMEKMSF